MNKPLVLGLIADGTSDIALRPIIAWALRDIDPAIAIGPITFLPRRSSGNLDEAMDRALEKYDLDVLFVHRDAEKMAHEVRLAEIRADERVVPIVPVRMTEAWLLIDEVAIRCAAGNPNGRVKLDLPKMARLEALVDPKKELRELLARASELAGRRLQQFDRSAAVLRVADLVEDFAPLRAVAAFDHFYKRTKRALEELEG